MAITQTIRVSFGAGITTDQTILIAEMDDRLEGPMAGNTSDFDPGDDAYFLVFKSADITGVSVTTSLDGYGSPPGGAWCKYSAAVPSVTREVDVEFNNENISSLSYPATSLLKYTWIGSNKGTVALDTATNSLIVTPAVSGTKVFGVLKASISMPADLYKVSSPTSITTTESTPSGGSVSVSLVDFAITVLVTGTTV